jgi:hypothetical protein
MIKFVNIPQTMDIIFHGANSPFVHGHKFQQNEMIPWKYLKNGNVIYQFKGNCTQENTRLYIELIDGNHDPVIATVRIKTLNQQPQMRLMLFSGLMLIIIPNYQIQINPGSFKIALEITIEETIMAFQQMVN